MNLRHQIALNTHLKPGSPVSVPIGRRKTQQQLHFQQFIFGWNISASPTHKQDLALNQMLGASLTS